MQGRLTVPGLRRAAMAAFRNRSDPGLVAAALVLVAVSVVVAGIIGYAGDLAWRPCAEACACGEATR